MSSFSFIWSSKLIRLTAMFPVFSFSASPKLSNLSAPAWNAFAMKFFFFLSVVSFFEPTFNLYVLCLWHSPPPPAAQASNPPTLPRIFKPFWRRFFTDPKPFPTMLNKLFMGSMRGPIIESIILLILFVKEPIKSSTAHSRGFMNPLWIILVSNFLIVPPNAFLIVEPRHPNAPKSLPIGLNAVLINELLCASAAIGLEILLKIKFFAAIKPVSIKPVSFSCKSELKLVVRPLMASVISPTAVSRSSIILKAPPSPFDALFKNLDKDFWIFDASDLGKHS